MTCQHGVPQAFRVFLESDDFEQAVRLATLAILDAQVSRYEDLPRTIDGLHETCTESKALNLSGMFGRCEEGTIVITWSNNKGRSLDNIDRTNPDYLQWMLRDDYFDDTKSIASEALKQGRGEDLGGIDPPIGQRGVRSRDDLKRSAVQWRSALVKIHQPVSA